MIVTGSTSLRRFSWPPVNFTRGSGSAGRQGRWDRFAARRVGFGTRVTGQRGAAVICLVDDRATGFGSGCRSLADPERLQSEAAEGGRRVSTRGCRSAAWRLARRTPSARCTNRTQCGGAIGRADQPSGGAHRRRAAAGRRPGQIGALSMVQEPPLVPLAAPFGLLADRKSR